jgi:hypothetical protein
MTYIFIDTNACELFYYIFLETWDDQGLSSLKEDILAKKDNPYIALQGHAAANQLVIIDNAGTRSCQFDALADQLCRLKSGKAATSLVLRQEAVKYLTENDTTVCN